MIDNVQPKVVFSKTTFPPGQEVSTITKPNTKAIIRAIATILHSQITEDKNLGRELNPASDLYFFSEEKYIKEKPDEFDEQRITLLRTMPTIESIVEFLQGLYECADFSPECLIMCLLYINRLIALAELPLQPTNWRPLVMCSLLVAQKVWDDESLSNANFAYIYPFFDTEEVNRLEKKFLERLQYNVIVKPSLYAKYYFELRNLVPDEADFGLNELGGDEAKNLERRSTEIKEKYKKLHSTSHM